MQGFSFRLRPPSHCAGCGPVDGSADLSASPAHTPGAGVTQGQEHQEADCWPPPQKLAHYTHRHPLAQLRTGRRKREERERKAAYCARFLAMAVNPWNYPGSFKKYGNWDLTPDILI